MKKKPEPQIAKQLDEVIVWPFFIFKIHYIFFMDS